MQTQKQIPKPDVVTLTKLLSYMNFKILNIPLLWVYENLKFTENAGD